MVISQLLSGGVGASAHVGADPWSAASCLPIRSYAFGKAGRNPALSGPAPINKLLILVWSYKL